MGNTCSSNPQPQPELVIAENFQNYDWFFNREKEEKLLEAIIEEKACFSLVMGPTNCGKSSLLNKTFLKLHKEKKIFYIRWDFKSFGPADFKTLYGLINQSFLLCTREILTEEKSKTWTNTLSIAGSVGTSGGKVEAKKQSEKKDEEKNIFQKESQRIDISIADFMMSLKNFQADLQNISKLNKIKVVLVIDEAQKLKKLEQGSMDDVYALRHLFDWLIALTKMDQSAYVFLVSSEEFFYFWMRDLKVYIEDIITIGNLSKNEAKKYFDKYTAEKNQNLKITFENLFKITGGNMSLIGKYCNKIHKLSLETIDEMIEIEGVKSNFINYFKTFKAVNDQKTCKNLQEVFEVIRNEGYYLDKNLEDKFDVDFLGKLLKEKNSIFHYQKMRPYVADDLDDIGLEKFKPTKIGALFFSEMSYYYICQKEMYCAEKVKNILEEQVEGLSKK